MRILILSTVIFLTGCLDEKNVKIQRRDDHGSKVGPVIECKLSTYRSECGPTYTGCSDGIDHGCGVADPGLWLDVAE